MATRFDLASQALHIVVQHSMLAELGWYPDVCERHIGKLKEEIFAHQSKTYQDSTDLELSSELEQDGVSLCSFDCIDNDEIEKNSTRYLIALSALLERNEIPSELIRTLDLHEDEYYYNGSLEKVVDKILDSYLMPYYKLWRYHAFRLCLAIREKYLTLHRAVVGRLQQQRERYSHVSGGSLIVYQLHHWYEQWSAKVGKHLELILCNFALYPFLLQTQYDRERHKLFDFNVHFGFTHREIALAMFDTLIEELQTILSENPVSYNIEGNMYDVVSEFETLVSEFTDKVSSLKTLTETTVTMKNRSPPCDRLLGLCKRTCQLLEEAQPSGFEASHQNRSTTVSPSVQIVPILSFFTVLMKGPVDVNRNQQLYESWMLELSRIFCTQLYQRWYFEFSTIYEENDDWKLLDNYIGNFNQLALCFDMWLEKCEERGEGDDTNELYPEFVFIRRRYACRIYSLLKSFLKKGRNDWFSLEYGNVVLEMLENLNTGIKHFIKFEFECEIRANYYVKCCKLIIRMIEAMESMEYLFWMNDGEEEEKLHEDDIVSPLFKYETAISRLLSTFKYQSKYIVNVIFEDETNSQLPEFLYEIAFMLTEWFEDIFKSYRNGDIDMDWIWLFLNVFITAGNIGSSSNIKFDEALIKKNEIIAFHERWQGWYGKQSLKVSSCTPTVTVTYLYYTILSLLIKCQFLVSEFDTLDDQENINYKACNWWASMMNSIPLELHIDGIEILETNLSAVHKLVAWAAIGADRHTLKLSVEYFDSATKTRLLKRLHELEYIKLQRNKAGVMLSQCRKDFEMKTQEELWTWLLQTTTMDISDETALLQQATEEIKQMQLDIVRLLHQKDYVQITSLIPEDSIVALLFGYSGSQTSI